MSNLRQIQGKKPHDPGQYLNIAVPLPKQYAPKKPAGNCNIDGGNLYISVTA